MKIIWNTTENYFQAEFTPGELWSDDQQSAQAAGFKTTGPPNWIWHTAKAEPLTKLRSNRPKSGLVLTQLALEKFNQLHQSEQKKLELKKEFQKLKNAAKKTRDSKKHEYYFDEQLGFECIIVAPAKSVWVNTFKKPESPKERCLICDDPLYPPFDRETICMWCEKEMEETLDNQN